EIEKSLSGYSYPVVLDVGISHDHCTKSVEKSIGGKLKHYKRCSSRRPLIQGFVNNQSRTNLLLKQKRKAFS
ncbi:hypothetical protein D918_07815, partial [Trichuris suis]